MFSFRGMDFVLGWLWVMLGCHSVLELICSIFLCPVLDSATPWTEGSEHLPDELGEGFIEVMRVIKLIMLFHSKILSAFVIYV